MPKYIGKPCKYGHDGMRYASGNCVACTRKKSNPLAKKIWRKNYPQSTVSWKRRNPYHNLISSASGRSRRYNIEYNLSLDWAKKRWTGKCELTGLEFDLSAKLKAKPFSPSIDRIDPNIGYLQENCRFVLWGINAFKGTGGDIEMMKIANALVSHG